MASATQLPLKSITFTTALLVAAGLSRVNIHKLLVGTFTGPGSYSRIAILAVVLANLKNVPYAWHFRVWNGILKHCLFSIPRFPSDTPKPSTLFLPVITTSHSPVAECDYNLHKSNSTYFADLDVSRSHLVCCLFQPGIDALQHNPARKLVTDAAGKPVKGRWGIMLGAVHCSFKREIKPYEPYEMWSRMLCYDRKWIYIVTHFVKAGTVRPSSYILGDGSWFGGKNALKRGAKVAGDADAELDQKAIFASALSKYVVKLGRLTIHPEVMMEASGMLPPRPGGWANMRGEVAAAAAAPASVEDSYIELEFLSRENGNGSGSESVSGDEGKHGGEEEWDWKRTVAMNEKGLKLAEHFAALDNLQDEFTGSKEPALGRYRDFLL
ncbi:hypothetical protein BP6252_13461 [Coleophoma cylindrospora]|uniref:Capsule polysaccharide biosynthesis protein n=1 Tax=Coleophoma cylindrospora TaxID=1849047 RepID=A0A3D8Q8Q0_9HELO|nr:hypothetical protein BP6252_13461 [Coleophoma cylindrospora]